MEKVYFGEEGTTSLSMLQEKWKLLTIAIDLCGDKIEKELYADKRNDVGEALTEILRDWIENIRKGPAIDKLITVLESNGLTALAYSIKDDFFPSDADRQTPKQTKVIITKESSEIEDVSFYPTEAALGNPVILQELFPKLSIREQMDFRLAYPQLCEHTLPFWRRSTWISINKQEHPTLQQFFELFSKSDEGNFWKEDTYNLLKYPFRRYDIFQEIIRPPSAALKYGQGTIRNCENFFWEVCAPSITHLKLRECSTYKSGLFKLFQWLIRSCPQLQELTLSELQEDQIDERQGEGEREGILNNWGMVMLVAEKLHTLDLTGMMPKVEEVNNHKRLFRMLPNLKNLTLSHSAFLGPMLHPLANGEFMKLNKVDINCRKSKPNHFLSMKKYVEKFPDTIKHLRFTDVDLIRTARVFPFNIYGIIAQCKNLEYLDLNICTSFPTFNWFLDLSPFTFTNLKQLKLTFRLYESGNIVFPETIKFDFGTLRGMPDLESLSIRLCPIINLRVPGTGDWLYDEEEVDGPRDMFLPEGIRVSNPTPESFPPLVHKNLKTFKFESWTLTKEDVSLLQNWFPNLTYIKAAFTNESFAESLKWKDIERITLLNRFPNDLDLREVCMAKWKHKKVKIIVENQDSKGNYGKIEAVKEGDHVIFVGVMSQISCL